MPRDEGVAEVRRRFDGLAGAGVCGVRGGIDGEPVADAIARS